MNTSTSKVFIVIGAILGWFGVIGQLVLILQVSPDPVGITLIRFISYFTILTNTLAALCFTYLWLASSSSLGKHFAQPTTLTAITVYIAVVGLTYNTVLRFIWAPTGLQRVVDEILHLINPVFFIIFWSLFVPKSSLKWRDLLPWMIFPLAYCIYVLIRGSITSDYPYPFMNVDKLGYSSVLINCLFVCVAFFAISLVLIAIGRRQNSRV